MSPARHPYQRSRNSGSFPLPSADVERDALRHAKLLRSLAAKGLEPAGISSQIQFFIHGHLQAAARVHRQGETRLGSGSEDRSMRRRAPGTAIAQVLPRHTVLPGPGAAGNTGDWRWYQRMPIALATTIGNVGLDTKRRRDWKRDGCADGRRRGRPDRDVGRNLDRLGVLRRHRQCCKSERGKDRASTWYACMTPPQPRNSGRWMLRRSTAQNSRCHSSRGARTASTSASSRLRSNSWSPS